MLEINEYHSVSSCIVQISKRELFWKPTLVMKIDKNQMKNEADFIDEMFRQLISNKMPYIAINSVENGTLNVSIANYMLVIYFKNCEAMGVIDFNDLEINIKYLFVLESFADCSLYFKGTEDMIAKYDISTFVKISNGDHILYTYVPDIDHETCKVNITKSLLINSCSKGKLATATAFPSKVTTNFKKCPFKVGMGSLYPFSMIENKESLNTYDPLDLNRVKGMDFEIIKIMTEYFNATLDLYYIFKEEENPYVSMEYLPLLLNGSLEACAGGLYRIYGDVVAYSGVYAGQSVMWIYSAEREIKTWENMAADIDGLYFFIAFYLCYSVVWCLIRTFDKDAFSFQNTLLYSWGALLGTTSLQDAKSFKQKVLNLVYLNMCLHLSVYISIQLYSFLTIRGPPEMFKTNEGIMKSGRTPYLNTLTKYFIKDEKYERFANTSTECDGFQDCAEVSLLRKGVTVFISGYFYPFQAATAVNDEARMLRPTENLLTVFYEMIIRKESPLVLKFQKAVVRLFEAGLTEKLFKEAIGLTVVGRAKIATQTMVTSSYACHAGCKLGLDQISGVFYVWCFGCTAAFCLFIMEIMMKRNVNAI